jgi:hypothetical protein
MELEPYATKIETAAFDTIRDGKVSKTTSFYNSLSNILPKLMSSKSLSFWYVIYNL